MLSLSQQLPVGLSSSNNASGFAPVRNFPFLQESEKAAWFSQLWKEKRLGEGVVLTVFDAVLAQEFSLEFNKSNPLIDFGFFLEGAFVNRMDTKVRGGMELHNRAGEYGVGYMPEMCGAVHFPVCRKLRILHVHVLPSFLYTMLGKDVDRLSPGLSRVLAKEQVADIVYRNRQSPLVQAVANELFYSVRNNIGIGLYTEGKVSELLSLVLTDTPSGDSESHLCPRLRDIVHAIRDELEERYAAPPTLAEISAKYHMPIANIQAGFKSAFGMSVFAFVKEFKLQRARQLFVEGDMNVSEVAWDIGYTNLSHFSSAYKKRFGVLPKAYLRSVREFLHTPSKAHG